MKYCTSTLIPAADTRMFHIGLVHAVPRYPVLACCTRVLAAPPRFADSELLSLMPCGSIACTLVLTRSLLAWFS